MQYTRQTKSLATAIACMLSGSLPADHGERNNIVADFVTLIEDLAGRAETQAGCLMESILTRNKEVIMSTEIEQSKRLGPVELARLHTHSKQKAINAFCYLCMGGDETENPSITKSHVRDCQANNCPLHPHRPWKNSTTRLRGDSPSKIGKFNAT